MALEFLSSPQLPQAVGAYSCGTKYGNTIITSGQIAVDEQSGLVVTDITVATAMVLQNLLHVVEAGGGRLDTIARVDIYLKDLKDFEDFDKAYAAFFGDHKPARVTVQAGNLAEGATIEAAAIAFVAE
mgnify:CR=1 FL=1